MPFTNMVGNGGLLSTMDDLLRWNENLDHPTVGGPAYVEAMETRMRLTNGRTISYALGLEVGDYHGIREVAHGGSTAGYRTYLARYPEQHVSVAVWCNYAGANAGALAHQVADLVLSKNQSVAAQATAMKVEVPTAEIARWAGTYRDPHTDQTITFVATERGLARAVGGRGGAGGARETTPLATLAFNRFMSPQGEVVFNRTPGKRTFDLLRPDGDTLHFQEVRPASTIAAADYVGTYVSDELDAEFIVLSRNGKLVLTRRPYETFELQPMYVDDFEAGGGLGSLRFARDARGRVTGFSFFAGRVLDVRFRRLSDRPTK
jgi:hypothetical protein